MKSWLTSLLTALPAVVSAPAALAAPEGGIDAAINGFFAPIAGAIFGIVFYPIPIGGGAAVPAMVLWLIIAATFFTVYFGFINIRGMKQGVKLIRGDYSNPNDTGEVSHFQALATALSGTVGLGNIAGVAIAISVGGPGATFWMIVAGLLGMSSKFTECTLGVKYRRENPDGSVSGGPMYYLRHGIAEHYPKLAGMGKVLAILFAISCILGSMGGGNMFQANQSFQQVVNISGGEASWLADKGWIFGIVLAVMVASVIIGGIQSIARVTSKLVPFMAILYLACGIYIILADIGNVGAAFGEIISGAFTPEAGYGGLIGVLIQGFRRAAFSNEAGIGSASIAHSAVKTKEPITEGLVALWEPFIDTVVICTMTALVIIITGMYQQQGVGDGVQLTSMAYSSVLSWFPYLLTIAVFLFAFSTMLSWSYYGEKSACYLFGESNGVKLGYKLVFCLFIIVGSSANLGAVTDFSDAMIFVMALPNIIGLYLLAPVVKRELGSYFARVKSGEIKSYRN
ncbi:MAG TPA: alanine/glycine:cation symporter family protein [Xanthomonadaceae bacterium]|nr:alanine/glycine:cation symporter family protein [Xanthomonadaceae bacterium]HRX99663.1 alanine/glycine:cation symporter family protein [Xanthomonadaceae bacterium]